MVNNIVKVILFLGACFLGYLVYNSIMSEIEYRREVERIENLVIDKLETIREAELIYKDARGDFTNDFDSLTNFMKNGKLQVTIEYGDKDDTTTEYRQEVMMINVRDSFFRGVNIDSIAFVPPMDTTKFILLAGRVTQGNVRVPVFKVEDPYPFNRKRGTEKHHPQEPLRVGSMSEATYSGNWK